MGMKKEVKVVAIIILVHFTLTVLSRMGWLWFYFRRFETDISASFMETLLRGISSFLGFPLFQEMYLVLQQHPLVSALMNSILWTCVFFLPSRTISYFKSKRDSEQSGGEVRV